LALVDRLGNTRKNAASFAQLAADWSNPEFPLIMAHTHFAADSTHYVRKAMSQSTAKSGRRDLLTDERYYLASKLFIKALALIYLAAFATLISQITALAGPAGIYPVHEQLSALSSANWLERISHYPSLFWLNSSDSALVASTWLGCGFALLLLLGIWERVALIALFLLYLSLFHAGDIFMNFQWDYLLLEAGFLAIFLANGQRITVWLFRWLLFRVRLLSGLSKLVSGDLGWSELTALSTYFETQPLPHVGAWYAHQLPDPVLAFGTAFTLFVELIVPFFFFLPRRWRMLGGGLTLLLQLLIVLTSNHNFFNLLTMGLCLFLFDDQAIGRCLPRRMRGALLSHAAAGPRKSGAPIFLIGLLIVPTSLVLAADMLARDWVPGKLLRAALLLEPFHIVHRYHVFPTVDVERLELALETTVDGKHWLPYEFRYKPGNPARAPDFVVPHQPRIDWMMWFVPKGPFFLDWFDRFLTRLLAGSAPVASQMRESPFDQAPLVGIRVKLYRYRFTDSETRSRTGDWWQLEYLGPFYPLPGRLKEGVKAPLFP
jgi:hypothetical protein